MVHDCMYTNVHGSLMQKIEKVKISKTPNSRWVNETCYMHTMECCPALKLKEVRIHIKPWSRLKDIMLSEVIQTQKERCCRVLFIGGT